MSTPAFSPRVRQLLLVAGACLLVAGCAGSAHQDLKSELAQRVVGLRGHIEPLPVYAPYTPVEYGVANDPDPFNPAKAKVASRGGANAPDLKRKREPLEAFPLETMHMVGSLTRNGQTFAVVSTERGLYRVHAGNYMGQNFGRVTKVTEGGIDLVELTQDGDGNWTEHPTHLALEEGGLVAKK